MLFHFIMVNSAKTFLIKKNHLTCDSTTEEVLTTLNNDYKYIYPNTQNLIYRQNNKAIQRKEVSQIWCHDQDSELPHGKICLGQ